MNAGSEPRSLPLRAVAIVGPTAVGKSGLGVELARVFNADVISADSRQVYRYMDVGTDKVSLGVRAQIPHFMLDVVAPDDVYSAQRYRDEALRVLCRSAGAGRLPLVVGGTGFYMRTLLDGVQFPRVAPNPAFREALRRDELEAGAASLHRRLQSLDPRSAERIHPNNLPRIIRALEVVEALGGPVPESPIENPIPTLYIGLAMERQRLHAIADRRVEQQFSSGLVEETERLLDMGYSASLPSLDGLAYRQAVGYLQGALTREEGIREYKSATHRYIRRQMTWFRQDDRIRWIDSGPSALADAASLIRKWLSAVERGLSTAP